jgi:DNA helicase-2/ATP-dependent DNA helicase PcrA
MTAHKAKGLEFDVVFILGCQEDVWGTGARHHSSAINFPHNLEIEPAGQSSDDCLRLFFVAATRARHTLYCCSYQTGSNGKASATAGFLTDSAMERITHSETPSPAAQIQALRADWQTRHLPHAVQGDWRELLRPNLANYQLSATHLNNFLDVSIGGPQAFLLQNLLRFPQAMTSNAVFGSAIHAALRRAHVHLAQTGEHRPTEDILHDFELQLQLAHLGPQEQLQLIEKGSTILTNYLLNSHDRFTPTQKAEYTLRNVQLGDMRLTGTLDLLDIDETNRTITVTDYKTGKAPIGWQGRHDYEKIKLHRYRQQLLLYKLLVENSQDFSGKFTVERACLEFIEADGNHETQRLELAFDQAELDRFTKLLTVVWQRITSLDLPDIGVYAPNYTGLLSFEDDLLAGKV